MFMNKKVIFITAIILILLVGLYALKDNNMTDNKKVKFETTQGDIVIELYGEMPITAGNFEKLVSEGFYNGVIFHRIIPGFMI